MSFFRKSTPSGMVTQLLESCRNADGQPRTRVVVSLGDLDVPEADRLGSGAELLRGDGAAPHELFLAFRPMINWRRR
jgi:hypothetical protein